MPASTMSLPAAQPHRCGELFGVGGQEGLCAFGILRPAEGGCMRTKDLAALEHTHRFDSGNAAAERGTRLVMWITAAR